MVPTGNDRDDNGKVIHRVDGEIKRKVEEEIEVMVTQRNMEHSLLEKFPILMIGLRFLPSQSRLRLRHLMQSF